VNPASCWMRPLALESQSIRSTKVRFSNQEGL